MKRKWGGYEGSLGQGAPKALVVSLGSFVDSRIMIAERCLLIRFHMKREPIYILGSRLPVVATSPLFTPDGLSHSRLIINALPPFPAHLDLFTLTHLLF
jgi:hypothetical protein